MALLACGPVANGGYGRAGSTGVYQGGYTGVGTRRGLYRCTTQLLEEGPISQRSGPVAPAGGGVVGIWEPDAQCALQEGPTPAGPGRSPRVPSLVLPSA